MTNAERQARFKARRKAGLVLVTAWVPKECEQAVWQAIDGIIGRLDREAQERMASQ